ncbi:TPA: hypothetical protein EYP44_02005 [Candidatus Bathyarchaeota archaeon]|nr:hypothetical protein [Candidatus Bathyarchaeota archaeon]
MQLVSAPLIVALSFAVGLIIYWIGGRIAPKGRKVPGKLREYICGEDLPTRKLQVNVERFLIYVVYFLIFDVVAFVLATSFASPGVYPVVYSLIVGLAIVVLLPLLRGA